MSNIYNNLINHLMEEIDIVEQTNNFVRERENITKRR